MQTRTNPLSALSRMTRELARTRKTTPTRCFLKRSNRVQRNTAFLAAALFHRDGSSRLTTLDSATAGSVRLCSCGCVSLGGSVRLLPAYCLFLHGFVDVAYEGESTKVYFIASLQVTRHDTVRSLQDVFWFLPSFIVHSTCVIGLRFLVCCLVGHDALHIKSRPECMIPVVICVLAGRHRVRRAPWAESHRGQRRGRSGYARQW